MAKFRSARFGLFVHYGPVSIWGDEISFPLACKKLPCTVQGPNRTAVTIRSVAELRAHREAYVALAKQFNPTKLDFDAMAELASNAGFGYLTAIAQHCDTFSMFDDANNPYNILNTPYGRDYLKEMFVAFRAHGIRSGSYVCPSSWTRNDYWAPNAVEALGGCCDPTYQPLVNETLWANYTTYLHYVLETLTSPPYSSSHLWIDSGDSLPAVDTHLDSIYSNLIASSPELVMQVRGNAPSFDYAETSDHTETDINAIYGTTYLTASPFEVPATLAQQWAYNPDAVYKDAATVLTDLAHITAHSGNFLLNIGPGPTGEWAPGAIQTLTNLSSWMAFGREALLQTATSPAPIPSRPFQYSIAGGLDACITESQNGSFLYITVVRPLSTDSTTITPLPTSTTSTQNNITTNPSPPQQPPSTVWTSYRSPSSPLSSTSPIPTSSLPTPTTSSNQSILFPFVKSELLSTPIQDVVLLGGGEGGGELKTAWSIGMGGLEVNFTLPPMGVSLGSYWSVENDDMAPCATRGCSIYTKDAYEFVREEGYCFLAAGDGLVPANLFFQASSNSTMQDNTLFQPNDPSIPPSYSNIRTECFVFEQGDTIPGLIPLFEYYNAQLEDRWILASQESIQEAETKHYSKIKTIGYILSSNSSNAAADSALAYGLPFKISF